MAKGIHSLSATGVQLLPGILKNRQELTRTYLLRLGSQQLLQNHYFEAGVWTPTHQPENSHWGWESPTSKYRGHFLGHWLSAAAKLFHTNGDRELKAKADVIVTELGNCQVENGGEWVGSIPEKYLYWLTQGKMVGVPHYIVHKTLMGLFDMYAFAGNEEALSIIIRFACWFHRWTMNLTREQMDDVLDFETGGMLEVWANLYGITQATEHLELLYRYDRTQLFDRLLAGEDVLTNMHANTTIPEALGAARAWEVTGDVRFKQVVLAYWNCAVTNRGYFCTGGQTSGEIWCPPHTLHSRLGSRTQEHCTVYNMIRLADKLLQWTGEVQYADYIERNIYNGTLAQQHPASGMPAYYLPLAADSQKKWGSETEHFWCCHGSVVQAHTIHEDYLFYEDEEGLVINQYFDSQLRWQWNETAIHLTQRLSAQTGSSQKIGSFKSDTVERPQNMSVEFHIACDHPTEFTIKFRVPWWVQRGSALYVNDEVQEVDMFPSGYALITRQWSDQHVRLVLNKHLTICPLPDRPSVVAFMDGPVVLAGLEKERILYGDKEHPDSFLTPADVRQWSQWLPYFRTKNQMINFRFMPLYEIEDEHYTIYFPIEKVKG